VEKFNSKKPDQNDNMQREPGEISGFSDEQVLREFEEAMKSTIPLPPPPENEFEQICQRIEKENRMEQIDGFLRNIIFSARKDTPHAKPKRKISAFYDWPIRRRPAGKISVDCNCHIGSSKLLYTFLLVWLIDPQCADHPFGNSLFSDFFPEHYQAQSGK